MKKAKRNVDEFLDALKSMYTENTNIFFKFYQAVRLLLAQLCLERLTVSDVQIVVLVGIAFTGVERRERIVG